MKILVAMPVENHHRKMLEEAAPGADFLYEDWTMVDMSTGYRKSI